MNRSYGFTTHSADNFIPRIVREAKPKDQFLVVMSRNVAPGGEHHLTVLVREDALPPKRAGFVVAGAPLSKKWGEKIRGSEFRHLTIACDDPVKAANIARNEFQRVKNFVLGRTVRVNVLPV